MRLLLHPFRHTPCPSPHTHTLGSPFGCSAGPSPCCEHAPPGPGSAGSPPCLPLLGCAPSARASTAGRSHLVGGWVGGWVGGRGSAAMGCEGMQRQLQEVRPPLQLTMLDGWPRAGHHVGNCFTIAEQPCSSSCCLQEGCALKLLPP
jgi:hypothetical protein